MARKKELKEALRKLVSGLERYLNLHGHLRTSRKSSEITGSLKAIVDQAKSAALSLLEYLGRKGIEFEGIPSKDQVMLRSYYEDVWEVLEEIDKTFLRKLTETHLYHFSWYVENLEIVKKFMEEKF